uniref:Starch-binding domain-containing protein 1 n=2 Tax=Callorhinchus milii TaxID=7868 RepID=A0A4W3GX58_CALMI|eukprot:gi/632986862/ref/XP_007910474.1/ PREDICTED: starch-binding domain-containing protein 1 [Callorhinchus milii]
MTNSSSIGKDPNHCIGTTEQNSKEEGNYENKNQTEHCQKLHECSVLKDEDLDHKYQSESGCLSNETFDIDNSNDNNSDLPKEPTLLTEMTKDDEEWEILEEPNTLEVETKVSPEIDHAAKKIAAVSPLPLKIIVVKFQVHYVTELESQILAVMGNHEHLGQWENYVPLKPGKDGFWSGSVLLPMNSKIEWKFVMVENGKVRRWEECLNRCLETSHEDIAVHRCWGFQ